MILLCFHRVETLDVNCPGKETMRRYDTINYMLSQAIDACIILRDPNGWNQFNQQDFEVLLHEVHSIFT